MVSKSIYTPVSQDIEKSINYKSKRPNTLWAKYCKFVVILSGILTLILTTVFGLNMAYSYQTTNVTDTTLPTASTTLNVTDTTLPTASTTLNVTDTTLPTASTTLNVTDTTPTVQDEEETDVVTTLSTASTTLPTDEDEEQDEEETGVTEPLVKHMLQEDNGEYTTETDSSEEIQELKDAVISNKTIVVDSSNQSITVTN
jgi:hypothetical protein